MGLAGPWDGHSELHEDDPSEEEKERIAAL